MHNTRSTTHTEQHIIISNGRLLVFREAHVAAWTSSASPQCPAVGRKDISTVLFV